MTHVGGVLPLCSEAIDVFYTPNRLGKAQTEWSGRQVVISKMGCYLFKVSRSTGEEPKHLVEMNSLIEMNCTIAIYMNMCEMDIGMFITYTHRT